jgi:tryptophan-rich sensory protein
LPSFNPPSWVFAPVWTTLYIMMSIAIWRIWINSFDLKLLKLYLIHLFFNGTWSVIFFGFHQISLALINLTVIVIFIILLMKRYFTRDKVSFYLMTPYFLWSSYALILNSAIFILN